MTASVEKLLGLRANLVRLRNGLIDKLCVRVRHNGDFEPTRVGINHWLTGSAPRRRPGLSCAVARS
jgi:hypothetical protein